MTPAKILVVDDTPRNVKFLADLLGIKGYSVVTATSGAEALKQVAAENPDLVLLDVVMPDMSGYEVCRRIRATAETAITRDKRMALVVYRPNPAVLVTNIPTRVPAPSRNTPMSSQSFVIISPPSMSFAASTGSLMSPNVMLSGAAQRAALKRVRSN